MRSAYLQHAEATLERLDSPWYPTMRLFRQQRAGQWSGGFAQMADELSAWIARGGGATS